MAQPQDDHVENYEQLRDAFSTVLVERVRRSQPQPKPKRRIKAGSKSISRKTNNEVKDEQGGSSTEADVEELADFIEYLASETFDSIPSELQSLDHRIWAETPVLQDKYSFPLTGTDVSELLPALNPCISESLITYGILDESQQGVNEFLVPVLTSYITAVTTPPPPPRTTKDQTTACEICDRDWVPLTYHHLIPRFVHAKVLKRGWHREDELQNVAWLCRSCHSFVHHFAGHEDLARYYYTVELLLEQEEVQAFAKWVGRLRWRAGKTKSKRT